MKTVFKLLIHLFFLSKNKKQRLNNKTHCELFDVYVKQETNEKLDSQIMKDKVSE